jgi:hypothetical protein
MALPSYVNRFGVKVEMPYATKERPRCRKVIEQFCRQHGLTVVDMLDQLKKERHVIVYEEGTRRTVWFQGNMLKQLRLWSVVETCRQHGRGVWDFLAACMAAAAEGRVLPSLLTPPNTAHAA